MKRYQLWVLQKLLLELDQQRFVEVLQAGDVRLEEE